MNVSNVGTPNPYGQVARTQRAGSSESVGESAQVLLLKKLLEAQRRQSEEIIREAEGKGQIIDIRV